jgi:hypothetical protein
VYIRARHNTFFEMVCKCEYEHTVLSGLYKMISDK